MMIVWVGRKLCFCFSSFFTCAAGGVKNFLWLFSQMEYICADQNLRMQSQRKETQLLQAQVSRVFPVTIVWNCMVTWMERKRLSFSRLLYERLLCFAFCFPAQWQWLVSLQELDSRDGVAVRDRLLGSYVFFQRKTWEVWAGLDEWVEQCVMFCVVRTQSWVLSLHSIFPFF